MAFLAAPLNTMVGGFGFAYPTFALPSRFGAHTLGEPVLSELSLGALWEGTHFISRLQKQHDRNVRTCPSAPLAVGVGSEMDM